MARRYPSEPASALHFAWQQESYCLVIFNSSNCLLHNLLQVLEVRHVLNWDKGKAVEFLLESLGEWSLTALWNCPQDFNGHIGATPGGYDDVHGGFGFGDRNEGGTSLLDFARSFDLVIASSSFPKKREHLVTFWSSVAETQIDYVLCRKSDRGLCMDCKVIPSENLSTLHRLLIMDLEIKRKRRKRAMYSQHRIKWGALTEAKAQELGIKLVTMGAWRSSGDASAMWTMTAQCIREAAREVLGVSKGNSGGHKGDWWWNGEVQGKVDTKKAAYLKLVESVDEEEKRANREH
ncbi:PREDICTED: uncharacterized protein LOC109219998 [Nicotiana attenuata]|uniref:uncharacterized protein LOC109219998 n=1 Tax=Nicotiana attenuata TaxID=49451 RepID=UPI000905C383|nr:PREDICTED: uncharacterized protein LOC109219998 [Nicotiana attenuata]